MMHWPWYYTVMGVVASELLYLLARYEYSGPEFRRRVYDYVWSYALSWLAIVGVVAINNASRGLALAIAGGFGIKDVVFNPSQSFFESLLAQEAASWVTFLILTGLTGGLGGVVGKIVGFQYAAFEWFMADLAILYVLYLYWHYFNEYGLFAVTASLIIPRSTRPIGATLTAYYVVLSIALPILLGMALIEMPYTQVAQVRIPCNPYGVSPSQLPACLAKDVSVLVTGYFLSMIFNVVGGSYINGFHAMVWDALLDIAYALTWLFAAWLARLIDAGAFRLLEAVT